MAAMRDSSNLKEDMTGSSKKSRPGSSYSGKDKRNSKGFQEFKSITMSEEKKSNIKNRPYSSGGFQAKKNAL